MPCNGAFLFGLLAGGLFLGVVGFLGGLLVEDASDIVNIRNFLRKGK